MLRLNKSTISLINETTENRAIVALHGHFRTKACDHQSQTVELQERSDPQELQPVKTGSLQASGEFSSAVVVLSDLRPNQ